MRHVSSKGFPSNSSELRYTDWGSFTKSRILYHLELFSRGVTLSKNGSQLKLRPWMCNSHLYYYMMCLSFFQLLHYFNWTIN